MADSTCYLLEQWGRWAWTARGLYLKYPGITPFRRMSKTSSLPTPAISDVVACEVDQAVAALSVEDPKAGNAVVGYYLFGY
jgi:hypothetical protein